MVEWIKLNCQVCGKEIWATKFIAGLTSNHTCVDCKV